MSAEIAKGYLEHLEELLLERTRVSEQTACPLCHLPMTLTFKTPRTTTFYCSTCNKHLSRQTLR